MLLNTYGPLIETLRGDEKEGVIRGIHLLIVLNHSGMTDNGMIEALRVANLRDAAGLLPRDDHFGREEQARLATTARGIATLSNIQPRFYSLTGGNTPVLYGEIIFPTRG